MSPICEKAITEVLQCGNAILKFISPNDANVTGGHQTGFYLPKAVWEMYTPDAPEKGKNTKHTVNIEWQDGQITNSVVTWYGQGTRAEYRLTRFGKNFPFLVPDTVGELLHCLRFLLDLGRGAVIFGDSLMVVNMVNGTWGKKKPHKKFPHLQPYLFECRRLFKETGSTLNWIPREQNTIADSLSKRGMATPPFDRVSSPCSGRTM